MAGAHPTSVEEVLSTLVTSPKPGATTASQASTTTTNINIGSKSTDKPDAKPTPKTRTAPYSALPFHRPLSTGVGWGQHKGNIPSPLKVGSALAIDNPRLSEVDFMKIAKVYSGVYTFGLCIVTVVGLVLLRWVWNGCGYVDDHEYVDKRTVPEQKPESWWKWF
jgi:hypothetical protein